MHYIAWRILDGAVPYRDLFDMNFPGVYAIHVGVLALLGPSSAAWRAVDLALTAAVGVLSFRFARPFGARSAAYAALLFSAYHLMGGPTQEGQRDLFLFAFLLAAALAVARALESERMHASHSLLAGVWLGVGVAIKPQAALFAAIAIGALAVGQWRRGRPWLRDVALLAAGVALPLAAVTLWLAAIGALRSFAEILFEFVLPIYSKIGRVSVWSTLPASHYAFLALLTALAGAGAARAAVRRELSPRVTLACLGLAYGLFNYIAQGKGWTYHLIPWVGFACLLAASPLDALLAEGRRGERLALLAGLAALVLGPLVKTVRFLDDSNSPEARRLAMVAGLTSALAACRADGGTVQVFDTSQGGIHALFDAGIREPTRFLYDFPFFSEPGAEYTRRIRAELMSGLSSAPPECVVVFREGWPGGDYGRLDGFPELRDWLGAGFALSAETDEYRLYARRRDQEGHSGL
jgi:4-amino-4-deoxy-L-arabinose transferase-like glycosyltransferase